MRGTDTDYAPNWTATCTTNGVSVSVQGTSFCGTSGSWSQGATSDNPVSVVRDENPACWCKMVSPAVSKWVFVREETSSMNCRKNCSYYCSLYIQTIAAVKNALLSNLTD